MPNIADDNEILEAFLNCLTEMMSSPSLTSVNLEPLKDKIPALLEQLEGASNNLRNNILLVQENPDHAIYLLALVAASIEALEESGENKNRDDIVSLENFCKHCYQLLIETSTVSEGLTMPETFTYHLPLLPASMCALLKAWVFNHQDIKNGKLLRSILLMITGSPQKINQRAGEILSRFLSQELIAQKDREKKSSPPSSDVATLNRTNKLNYLTGGTHNGQETNDKLYRRFQTLLS